MSPSRSHCWAPALSEQVPGLLTSALRSEVRCAPALSEQIPGLLTSALRSEVRWAPALFEQIPGPKVNSINRRCGN